MGEEEATARNNPQKDLIFLSFLKSILCDRRDMKEHKQQFWQFMSLQLKWWETLLYFARVRIFVYAASVPLQ